MRVMTLVAMILTTTSCTTEYLVQPLPLPAPMASSDRLSQEELSCLSDETLVKVIKRDKRRKTLRRIIESTHKQD